MTFGKMNIHIPRSETFTIVIQRGQNTGSLVLTRGWDGAPEHLQRIFAVEE